MGGEGVPLCPKIWSYQIMILIIWTRLCSSDSFRKKWGRSVSTLWLYFIHRSSAQQMNCLRRFKRTALAAFLLQLRPSFGPDTPLIRVSRTSTIFCCIFETICATVSSKHKYWQSSLIQVWAYTLVILVVNPSLTVVSLQHKRSVHLYQRFTLY